MHKMCKKFLYKHIPRIEMVIMDILKENSFSSAPSLYWVATLYTSLYVQKKGKLCQCFRLRLRHGGVLEDNGFISSLLTTLFVGLSKITIFPILKFVWQWTFHIQSFFSLCSWCFSMWCPMVFMKISRVLDINKPAAQTAGQTLPDATQPLGKIPPFTKIAVTFDPTKQFTCPSRFRFS